MDAWMDGCNDAWRDEEGQKRLQIETFLHLRSGQTVYRVRRQQQQSPGRKRLRSSYTIANE